MVERYRSACGKRLLGGCLFLNDHFISVCLYVYMNIFNIPSQLSLTQLGTT